MNANFSFDTDCCPNMNLEWVLYHRSNWLCIMGPCTNGICKHLECCFIRKNNFLPVVTQVLTCPRQVNFLRSLSQERHFSWKNRNITEVIELTTYCTFADLKFGIFFF